MKLQEAIRIAYACAKEYSNNLLGRNLLFVIMDKHKNVHTLEVQFGTRQFQHLTGLKTDNITSVDFFNRCLDQRLSEDDVAFAEDGTTELKLRVLPDLMRKNLSAKMVGDYNNLQPKLITGKIAGNVNSCMGFVVDEKNNKYVPNTVLQGDIRDKVEQTYRIVLTYSKMITEEKYTEIVFASNKIDWDTLELPEEYGYLPLPE